MPNISSIVNILKHVPALLGIFKQLRGEPQAAALSDVVASTRHAMEDFKRTAQQRLDDLEKDNTRLRSRLKDADASITLLKAMIWASSAFALAAFVLALLAIVRMSFLH